MMKELKYDDFERARPLFDGFDYSLSIQAAIEGNNPGRIFVDDADRPRTAFALTVEGYLLAGDHNNPATNEALGRFLKEKIISGEIFVNGDQSMSLAVHPQAWESKLLELIPTHEIEKNKRYHYLYDALDFDWRGNIPEGYTVRYLDQALLDDPEIIFPDSIREWMEIEELWWSMENFLAKGISYVILHNREIVAWCTPDCLAGDRIDIGIITHPAHRRRGLASIAVAATVEFCLNQGFNAIGWHCNAENVASWKTAEKVGFRRNREYAYYYYMYDPIDHLAELGWYTYRHGEYAKTVQYYDRVFALREENPDYYYHLAASAYAILENGEKALEYLSAAADHGWTHAEYTEGQEEFEILHGRPEWELVLARMEGQNRRDA